MVVIGAFETIEGLLILLSPSFFEAAGGRVIVLNLVAWGWLHLVIGVLILVAGSSLLAGGPSWTGGFGLAVIGIDMVIQLVWLPAFPIWSLAIIALDLVVLYAIATAWPDWRTHSRST